MYLKKLEWDKIDDFLFEKAKSLPIGTVRQRRDGHSYKKTAPNTWVRVSKKAKAVIYGDPTKRLKQLEKEL